MTRHTGNVASVRYCDMVLFASPCKLEYIHALSFGHNRLSVTVRVRMMCWDWYEVM
jgi:hypothetical protein